MTLATTEKPKRMVLKLDGAAIAKGYMRQVPVNVIKIDPAVYFIDHLPVHVELLDVLAVIAFSLMVALVATLHPSRAAARLTPVEAIRHE